MWTDEQTMVLNAILDAIIPPSADGRIPGAGASGVAGFFASATPYAPDPLGTVTQILSRVTARPDNFLELGEVAKTEVLKHVEAQCPAVFGQFVQLTYMGYYSQPHIRPMFGVGVHPVHPNGYQVPQESDDLMELLTAPVRARGQIFRDG